MTKSVVLLKEHLGRIGGLEKATLGLIQAFQKKQVPVTLLTCQKPSISLPCEHHVLSKGSSFDSASTDWLKAHPTDVVFGLERSYFHTHYRAGNGAHIAYLKKRDLAENVITRFFRNLRPHHSFLLKWEKAAFEASRLRCLFTNSNMVRQEILEHYQVAPQKIHTVHNGVHWLELENFFEQSFHSTSTKYHFLFAGNGYKRKGLSYLLKGLQKLSHPFHLDIVGYDSRLSSWKQKAHLLGLSSSLTFHGPQPSLIPFLQKADCMVIPSLYDPFAHTTLEALAMGLYVISSPFNGGSEVIDPRDGETIENLFDSECMRAALEKAFKHPKRKPEAFFRRERYRHLDFSSQLDKIVEITLNHS